MVPAPATLFKSVGTGTVRVVSPVEVAVHTPLYLNAVPVHPEITTWVPVVIPWFVDVVIVATPADVVIELITSIIGALPPDGPIDIPRLAPKVVVPFVPSKESNLDKILDKDNSEQVQVTVPSTTVFPIVVGHEGSVPAEVPAVVQIYFLPFLVIGVTATSCLWIVAVPAAICVVAKIVYVN
jgi:hypothetical protein